MAERASGENFPVAMRLIPAKHREDLMAIYGFARTVDDIGDEPGGGMPTAKSVTAQDRLQALDEVQQKLSEAYVGQASDPIFSRLSPVLISHRLPKEPFEKLIEANRVDQRRFQYETFTELLEYCQLSANPVGELVLRIFGSYDSAKAAMSDDICSALQIVEHLQDIGQDAERGRVYLPQADMIKVGCSMQQLQSDVRMRKASPALRRAVALEASNARRMLESSGVLVASLRGSARLAVAGYAGGGLATLDALERANYDSLSNDVTPSKFKIAEHGCRLVLAANLAHTSRQS